MRRFLTLAIAGLAALAMSGCIIVPPRHGYHGDRHDHHDRGYHGDRGYRGR